MQSVLPFPTGPVTSTTLGPASAARPVILRTAEGAVQGAVTVDPGSWTTFWATTETGLSPIAYGIFRLPQSNASPVFNAIGSTQLSEPGGYANQLSVAVVGDTLVVLTTVQENGTMEAAISASGTQGETWNSPIILPLTMGSIIDPEIYGGQDGNIYATWLASDGGNLSAIEQAVLAPDGRLLSDPTVIPGGIGPWPVSNVEVVGSALDSFERPLLVWATPVGSNGNALIETGAFPSPSNIVGLERDALWNLTSADLVGSGNVATYVSGMSGILTSIASDAGRAGSGGYFNLARNLTADLYQNDSLSSLGYFGEQSSGSGSGKKYTLAGGADLTPAVETGPGYSPPETYGALVPSVGFGSAATYLSVETDWLLASEGVVPVAASNPLNNVSLPQSLSSLPGYGTPAYPHNTVDGKLSSATVTPSVINPTTAELGITGSFPTYQYQTTTGTTTCGSTHYPLRTDSYTDTPSTFSDTAFVNNMVTALGTISNLNGAAS